MSDLRITDEAVNAAAEEFYGGAFLVPDSTMNDLLRKGARAALEAAAPYLTPQPVTSREPEGEAAEELAKWYAMDEDDDTPWPSGLSPDNPFLIPAPQWWVTTGPFTDPLCQKVAGPFASRDEAIENRVRIEAYTKPVTFWVDSPTAAAKRRRLINGGEK